MLPHKRSFYLIGHNPNTIDQAKEYLHKGANALAPDVVYADGKYYIIHAESSSYGPDVPTLEQYLQSLKQLIVTQEHYLALIIWDMKTTGYDVNHFIAVVRENFSGPVCEGVAMIVTHANDHHFVAAYDKKYAHIGIGVDESNLKPDELATFFNNGAHRNFIYADGITTFLNKPEVSSNVRGALIQRCASKETSFRVVYTWVLRGTKSMSKYLGCYVDAIMVDLPEVTTLKKLITSEPYRNAYTLAMNGFNPFSELSSPQYILQIKTKDKFLAGTGAILQFTLQGSSGTLKGLPFHGKITGTFERGSNTNILLEGLDIGVIQCLTIEMLTGGIGSAWLPEKITIRSAMLQRQYEFTFDKNQWISKRNGPVTVILSGL